LYILKGKKEDDLLITIQTYENKNEEIKRLYKEKERFFDNIKREEEEIKKMLNSKFEIKLDDIIFDTENYQLIIKLNRERNQYSTSEINLMIFLINLYEFIASNQEIIVIDDPLSSYDITNQYIILYELISKINRFNNSEKLALIFTHNIETLNIVKSQLNASLNNFFEFENIEVYLCNDRKIRVLNKFFIDTNIVGSVFNIDNFISKTQNNIKLKEYIKYLKKLYEKDFNGNEYANLFHYNGEFTIENLSNMYFVNLIDNLTNNSLQNEGFYENGIIKITYMIALRVWIEYQLYQNIESDIQNKFIKKYKLYDKINLVFSNNGINWKGNSKVSKKFLLSKKVMLNQNAHSKDQISPFYYVLNISLYDLEKEINEIKEAFL